MSYVRRERAKNTDASFANTLGALRTFVEAHKIPFDALRAKFAGMPDDAPGIHDFVITEDSVVDDGKVSGKRRINITLTTPFLVRNNERAAQMGGIQKCGDGTWRINYQGMPLLVVGVVDRGLRFHLTAVELAYGEDISSLSKLLVSEARFADAVAKTTGFSLIESTTNTMNDNSDAAFAAVYDVLTNVRDGRNGNCAVHMLSNQKKKCYKNKAEHSKPLLDDLKFISKTSIGSGFAELLVDAFKRKVSPTSSAPGSPSTPASRRATGSTARAARACRTTTTRSRRSTTRSRRTAPSGSCSPPSSSSASSRTSSRCGARRTSSSRWR
jgi:hypothetical protein